MGSWFSLSAKKPAEEVRVSFEVLCECGEPIAGYRGEKFQVVECRGCGEEALILPRCKYPALRKGGGLFESADDPDPPVSKKSKPKKSTREKEAPGKGNQDPDSKGEVDSKEEKEGPRTRTKPAPRTALAPPPADKILIKKVGWHEFSWKRVFTPARIGIAVAILLVSLTTAYVIRVYDLQQAQVTLGEAERLAREAMEAGDWSQASEQFARCEIAIKKLNRTDALSLELVQWSMESRVIAHLLQRDLLELVEEAIEVREHDSLDAWNDTFSVSYQGKWIILDSTALRMEDGEQFLLDLPLEVQGEQVEIRFDFNSLLDPDTPRIIFGMQIDECRLDPDREKVWIISGKPGSAFLWANLPSYEKLFFVADPETKALLNQQSRLLGITKSEEESR